MRLPVPAIHASWFGSAELREELGQSRATPGRKRGELGRGHWSPWTQFLPPPDKSEERRQTSFQPARSGRSMLGNLDTLSLSLSPRPDPRPAADHREGAEWRKAVPSYNQAGGGADPRPWSTPPRDECQDPLPKNWEMAYTETGMVYFIEGGRGRVRYPVVPVNPPRLSSALGVPLCGSVRARQPSRITHPTPREGCTKRSFYLKIKGACVVYVNTQELLTGRSFPLRSHNTKTTTWLDPRLAKRAKPPEKCEDGELPYGWEKIEDPQYGTYYVDHISQKTQFENPVLEAKKKLGQDTPPANQPAAAVGAPPIAPVPTMSPPVKYVKIVPVRSPRGTGEVLLPLDSCAAVLSSGDAEAYGSPWADLQKEAALRGFTRDPSQLQGAILRTALKKSAQGFGFTIIGGDRPEEFLQVKNVLRDGPAAQDNKIAPELVAIRGDISLQKARPVGTPLPLASLAQD
ncbi:hypothetical protein P4O66_004036 [Electrophorus voltai]|uniref:WW domain-containing protein n=1 Tax=Electrophorus voltai TaxID=2609070 RepID=A0AAD9E158_9TELE|nr:hypothetical protein P4O66_004036 [Electrophorus voltai]